MAAGSCWKSFKTFLLLGLLTLCLGDGKSVNVDLRSNWPATSLVQEMSEFFAQESNELFWKFVEALGTVQGQTEKEQFEYANGVASTLITPLQAGLLQYTTSFRYFSPTVQAHRQVSSLALVGQADDVRVKLAGKQEEPIITEACPSWAKLNDRVYQSAEELKTNLESAKTTPEPLLSLDHVKGVFSSSLPTVHLYGCIGTTSFTEFHKILAGNEKVNYVLRHSVPVVPGTLPIPGFGVELAIKSLEYKTVDDKHTSADEENKEPSVHDEKMEDIKSDDIQNLGFQAAQSSVEATDPLRSLVEISQNFPTRAVGLTRIKLNTTLQQELLNVQIRDNNFALINGRIVTPSDVNPFDLYEILREQSTRMEALRSLGLTTEEVSNVLSIPPSESAKFTFKVDSPVIIHLNDLEKENRYAEWAPNVAEIFRRVWPGNFRYIRKNFHTAVIFLDPAKSLEMFSYLNSLISQAIPIRYGIVFNSSDEIGTMVATMFHYVAEHQNKREAVAMLGAFYQRAAHLTSEYLLGAFQTRLNQMGRGDLTASQLIEQNPYDDIIKQHNEFVKNFGVTELPLGFLNGQPVPGGLAHELMNNLINTYFQTSQQLQELVGQKEITDTSDIYDVLMNRPGILGRYSGTVLPSTDRPIKFSNLASRTAQQFLNNDVKYITDPTTRDVLKYMTHLLVTDFNTADGLQLALHALNAVEKASSETSRASRFGFVHVGNATSATLSSIYAAQASQLSTKIPEFLRKVLEKSLEISKNQKTVTQEDVNEIVKENNLNVEKFQNSLSSDEVKGLLLKHKSFAREVLNLEDGDTAVVSNGRIVEIIPSVEFNDLDFELLTRFEFERRTKPVEQAFQSIKFESIDSDTVTSSYISNVIMATSSLLGIDESNEVRKMSLPSYLAKTFSVDSTGGNQSVFQILAVLDPLSRDAQRFSALLEIIKKIFPCRIDVILRPQEHSELPLKTYYASAVQDTVHFDAQGRVYVPPPSLTDLPPKRLLTLALDTPESWLVGPTSAKYDLDNIRLNNLGKENSLSATFELQSITLQGNCADKKGSPPRGLQVVLGTTETPVVTDTLVMANLGYFQLKANPGVWSLRIKPNSRSEELYDIVKSHTEVSDHQVVISSFSGVVVPLRVAKKIDKFSEQLLVEDSPDSATPENKSVWQSLSGLWNEKKPNDTIHVFSLASGHLYERFLKIMMLSVVKNTQSNVKFWLLANFLSPDFKDTIPALATEYKFEYELVTYKWPSWLFAQTEKQRIIWAYKILFLDVLFPLDVKKVIYVDADQVVRADLKELWDMDLHGAPYAYTPFCDSNKATEGFRFWKKGFWETHLRGNPYHISALYVVDLFRFRTIAAGDQLRATYSQLAPDPNSLSNLDQDLPNYVQHNIKIFSLPQEWLWCETWCSNDTKGQAKTIDLCNNPLTKTPKLEAAVKIIPEWSDLDNEVKRVESEASHQPVANNDQQKVKDILDRKGLEIF